MSKHSGITSICAALGAQPQLAAALGPHAARDVLFESYQVARSGWNGSGDDSAAGEENLRLARALLARLITIGREVPAGKGIRLICW